MSSQWLGALFLIVLAGLVARIYAASASAIVNPDAAVYIQQARSICYGSWHDLGTGSLTYVTAYPALIAAVNMLAGDWIVSARAVSIIVSTLTLIVLYPLTRTFFRRDISLLLVLIYAFNPLFVTSGSDVVKDPGAWFFVVCGMLIFVRHLGASRPLPMISSSLLFMLAAWMRIEALVFLIGSGIYLLFTQKRTQWKNLVFFLSPILVMGCLGLIALSISHQSELLWARMGEIGPRIKAALNGYATLRTDLRELATNPPLGMPSEYFDQIRSITWLVGLGVIVRNAVEAYFLPFFALFVVGLFRLRPSLKEDARGGYFLLLVGLLFVHFYVFIFSCWVLEQRWLGTAIIVSFFFIGQGLRSSQNLLESRLKLSPHRSAAILAILILAVTLPKGLLPRERDKKVFLDISEVIASGRIYQSEIINILAPGSAVRWLSLYANKKVAAAPNPDEFLYDSYTNAAVGDNYDEFIRSLRCKNISYVLWAEKHWPRDGFDLLSSYKEEDLQRVGEWQHRDTGKMILFRVKHH